MRKFSVALLRSFDVMGGEVWNGVVEVPGGHNRHTLEGAEIALTLAFKAYIKKCSETDSKVEQIISMIVSEVTQ